MKPFIHDDFLLHGERARQLYHEHGRHQPIIDYHCHLPPAEVAIDRRWADLADIWLAGDHYKWRALRSNGIDERLCTGSATPREKFEAWAATMPRLLRNPLYHWSHLELKRYFDIDLLLSPATAQTIWEEAGRRLAQPDFTARRILGKFRVSVVCTTDDPADTLEHHAAIAASGLATKIYPTFRPDRALAVDQPAAFRTWLDRLESVDGSACRTLDDLLAALLRRHAFFHSLGGRLSDHGLERCHAQFPTAAEAARIFQKTLEGHAANPVEKEQWVSHLMLHFGRWASQRGWTMQLHLGPLRNNRTRLLQTVGPDAGADSVGDAPQAFALSRFLDRLDEEGALPKTVLYNINPADNYVMAAMAGNFQDGTMPGKIQFGSGWWFLDQKEGMEWQINALSHLGLLSRFVGMLTDSRSFLSYPRHEYFRRILCNMLGREMENGELPDDPELVGRLVEDVCYGNAARYFGFELGAV